VRGWKDLFLLFPQDIITDVSLNILYNGAISAKGNSWNNF